MERTQRAGEEIASSPERREGDRRRAGAELSGIGGACQIPRHARTPAPAREDAASPALSRRVTAAVIVMIMAASVAFSQVVRPARSSDCNSADPYARGLCLYASGDYEDAILLFRDVAGLRPESPRTIRAMYFLARCQMKRKQWSEASATLIRIYTLAPAFYEEWSCDFLLGETRRGMGLE